MIYIVRHGQTYANETNKSGSEQDLLNENGIAQAKKVSIELGQYPIKKIYSSDLERAKKTAEIINKKLRLELILDERLREFTSGIRSGLDRKTRPQEYYDNPNAFDAENPRQVFNRVKKFLDELKGKNEDNVLIISHGGVMAVMAKIFENPESTEQDFPTHHHFNKIEEYPYSKIRKGWRNFENCVIYKFENVFHA